MKADLSIQKVQKTDRRLWDHVVTHPLQSWSWGDFREKTEVKVLRLGVYQGKNLVDGWQIFFHSLPGLPMTVGYFPKGPAPTPLMLDALKAHSRRHHPIYIQLEPNVMKKSAPAYKFKNLIPSHRPLFTKYTYLIDLTLSESELFAKMHHKTRYNIRVAQKNNVRIFQESSPSAFGQYLRLMEDTIKRQKFYAHDLAYHRKMWDSLSQAKIARLFYAKYKNMVLASWIVFVWHDTIYYPYGASSRANKQVMASNLLLWEIMLWAKGKGLKKFDLWGCLGPDPDPSDPWFGFHRFKSGYPVGLVEFVGSYDLIINPPTYKLFTGLNNIRLRLLKIKKTV